VNFNRLQQLLAVSFLVFVTGSLVAVMQSNTIIHNNISEGVGLVLEASLHDEIVGSQADDKSHNEDAVLSVLNGVNEQLKSSLIQDGYNRNMLPVGLVAARISRFDDIDSAKNNISISGALKSSIIIVANNEVTVETYTSIKWSWVIAWLSLVLSISVVVYKVVPHPLTGFQHNFYNYLVERYRNQHEPIADEIIDFCSSVVQQHITLSNDTWWLVDVLLSGEEDGMSIKPISDAYRCATENSQLKLNDVQRAWIRFGWIRFGVTKEFSCDQVVDLALRDESVEVNLQTGSLLIKGVHKVNLPTTPFAYYCFYLNRRKQGVDNGWVPNTPPNHLAFNDEITEWLERVDAPLNATQEVDSTQLNNMRNRIVRRISESFNDESNNLSAVYGFESQSTGRGATRDFRVVMMPEQISGL